MATFRTIVPVALIHEGKPSNISITSYTQGTKVSEETPYVPPAPVASSAPVYLEKAANSRTVTTYK